MHILFVVPALGFLLDSDLEGKSFYLIVRQDALELPRHL